MKRRRFTSWRPFATVAVVLVLPGGAFLISGRVGHHPEDQKPAKFPEQLVYVRAKDDVVDAGALFALPRDNKPGRAEYRCVGRLRRAGDEERLREFQEVRLDRLVGAANSGCSTRLILHETRRALS